MLFTKLVTVVKVLPSDASDLEMEMRAEQMEQRPATSREERASESSGISVSSGEDDKEGKEQLKADILVQRLGLGIDAPQPSDSDEAKMKRLIAENERLKERLASAKKRAMNKPSVLRGVFKSPKKKKIKAEPVWRSCRYPCPGCKTAIPAFSAGVEKSQDYQVKVQTSVGDIIIYASKDLRLPCPLCLSFTQAVRWQGTTMTKDDLSGLISRPRQHLKRQHNKKANKIEWRSMRQYSRHLLCSALHKIPGKADEVNM